jgi:hypothetical protein
MCLVALCDERKILVGMIFDKHDIWQVVINIVMWNNEVYTNVWVTKNNILLKHIIILFQALNEFEGTMSPRFIQV